MSFPFLVKISTKVLLFFIKLKFPIHFIVKHSIFNQFCGGENENECSQTVDQLKSNNIYSILDYSVEGLNNEVSFDKTLRRTLSLINLKNKSKNFPFIVFKPTAIGSFCLYHKKSNSLDLSIIEQDEWMRIINRFNKICEYAKKNKVRVLIDAEESWIQSSIDEIVEDLFVMYNKDSICVYNTVQAYRHDRLDYLSKLLYKAKKNNFLVGIKLVRGAYMEKERLRAFNKGYLSPICDSKNETNENFTNCLNLIMNNISCFSLFLGSHNEGSMVYTVNKMKELDIQPHDIRIWFSQLYGMSDNISYNLALNGFNVAKYLPFGPVYDVIPYLLRRIEENSSVKGQSSRELMLFEKELKRR